jgi:hypothetical protein
MTSLPLIKGAALVVETEVPTRKPPLDRTAERGASAPAIGVAGALAAAGVVDPLEEGPPDPPSLPLLAGFEREACAKPDQYEPADSIERALDARSNEDVASACHGGRYRSADGPQYSVRPPSIGWIYARPPLCIATCRSARFHCKRKRGKQECAGAGPTRTDR